ncbi:MAG: DNA alkylation repair protein, partial [Rubrivivax sp.]|nr:DNA alkylation repair protein [Rubrivivax sp.]
EAALAIAPRRVGLGGQITLTLQLRSTSPRPQTLAIDYAVHHVKADGSRRPKVFKGWQIELPPREQTTLVKRHSLRAVTTRRYHGGEHLLAVQINGRTVAETSFTLVMPRTAGPG